MIKNKPPTLARLIKRRAFERQWIKSGVGLAWNRERARRRYRAGKLSGTEKDALMALYKGLCAYCGNAPATVLDHVKAIARGGKSLPQNMVPCCDSCNWTKRDDLVIPGPPIIDGLTEAERYSAWSVLVADLRLERALSEIASNRSNED